MSNSDSTKRGVRFKDMTGQVFGMLTVVRVNGKKYSGYMWLCHCECGQESTVWGGSLRAGSSRSCGCQIREATVSRNQRHGMRHEPEYSTFRNMWQRCTNPRHPKFKEYQGRTPPEDWRDFSRFLSDMGRMPEPGQTIERIRNDLPYGPGNCRWASKADQNRNKGNSVRVQLQGVDLCAAEACLKAGIKPSTFYRRRGLGWSIERASEGLFKPCN